MAPPSLKLRFLGPFGAEIDGAAMPALRLKKSLWALALLALRQRREVSREWLAETLWPASEPSKALFNLRHALATDLRPALGSAACLLRSPTPSTLSLDASDVWVDVTAFDAAISDGGPAALERAVALFRGPLLEGCQEEWVFPERTTRNEAFYGALERLADDAIAQGRPAVAVGHLRRLIVSSPLRESAHSALMQALALHGDAAGVRQVYRDLRLSLYREVNAEPSPQTSALYARLQMQSAQPALNNPAASEAAADQAQSPASNVSGTSSAPTPLRRLPVPLTRLIGREATSRRW
jgi:DNA-binding SARP family transcriptional activator